jgi:hypothetical protein
MASAGERSEGHASANGATVSRTLQFVLASERSACRQSNLKNSIAPSHAPGAALSADAEHRIAEIEMRKTNTMPFGLVNAILSVVSPGARAATTSKLRSWRSVDRSAPIFKT